MKLNPSNVSIIKRLLVGRSNRPLRTILSKLEPAEIAGIFNTLDKNECRRLIEALIDLDLAVAALEEAPEPLLEELLERVSDNTLEKLMIAGREDQSAWFLSLVEEERRNAVLERLPPYTKKRIELCLDYPEDSAGRLMQTHFFSLEDSVTAGEGLSQLRIRAQEESIYYIYCVDGNKKLKGVVSLRQLATAPSDKKLEDLVKTRVVSVLPETKSEEVARLVSQYNFVALPVVDINDRLLGLVTVDDVVDVIQEQATSEIYAQAGLQESDRVYTSISESVKKRMPWMFLNLGLACIASWVVSQFEETLSQTILLASLINIVAGMGGNTAIQTLTVVTRGLATGDFNFITYLKAITKEALVGMSNGLATGIGAGLLIYFWKGHLGVSVVICLSMICNSLVAASLGACVPLFLDKLDLDPATGSGVLVTTLTDMFSFFSFLGIATIGLGYFG